jgi:DNA-binding CsgD family transcriptional regulator
MASVSKEEIYAALFDDEALKNLPLLLAKAGNARSSLMYWSHGDGQFDLLDYCYFSPEMAAGISALLPYDPWLAVGLRRPNKSTLLEQFVPWSVFEKSAPYTQLIRPMGDDTGQCLGIVMDTPSGRGVLSVHRARSAPRFQEDDRAGFEETVGDFQTVLRVRAELAASKRAEDLARRGLDGLAVGVVIAAANGRVMSVNAAADEVLRRADGLVVRNGQLGATSYGASARLVECLTKATASVGPTATSVAIPRADGLPPYLATVSPSPGANGPAMALVVFRDPDFADPTVADRLRSLFGLTAAEAAVAVLIGQGRSPKEIGVERGVSLNTLHAQLKSIMAKINRNRQAEVAAIFAGLPEIR